MSTNDGRVIHLSGGQVRGIEAPTTDSASSAFPLRLRASAVEFFGPYASRFQSTSGGTAASSAVSRRQA